VSEIIIQIDEKEVEVKEMKKIGPLVLSMSILFRVFLSEFVNNLSFSSFDMDLAQLIYYICYACSCHSS